MTPKEATPEIRMALARTAAHLFEGRVLIGELAPEGPCTTAAIAEGLARSLGQDSASQNIRFNLTQAALGIEELHDMALPTKGKSGALSAHELASKVLDDLEMLNAQAPREKNPEAIANSFRTILEDLDDREENSEYLDAIADNAEGLAKELRRMAQRLREEHSA